MDDAQQQTDSEASLTWKLSFFFKGSFLSFIWMKRKPLETEKTAQTGKLESTFVYLAGEAVLIWGADVIIWGWKDELTTIVAVIKIVYLQLHT